MSRRDEVLDAALALLDEVGLDALTTRRLAERLGVQPGALYRHFPSKAALLDAMVEQVAASGVSGAEPGGDWAGRIRWMASGVREAMLSRRDGARLLTTFRKPGPEAERAWFRSIELLVAEGAEQAGAATAIDTVFAYVNGFTMEEQARGSDHSRRHRDQQFAAGLELIVTGIHASLPAAG